MAIFGPKPWVIPFGQVSIYQLFELLVFIAQQGIFSFYNIIKHIFLAYIALKKKKVEKTTIFGPKPWVNPFRKMLIFRLFELLVFIAWQGVFSFQNIIKDILLAYIALNKKLKKWPFLDQNAGLTPLKKCQFFRLFKLFVFIAQTGVFLFYNIINDILLAYMALNKKLKKWPFLAQNPGLTPLKKCQFFDFLNLLFLQPSKVIFRSRIS